MGKFWKLHYDDNEEDVHYREYINTDMIVSINYKKANYTWNNKYYITMVTGEVYAIDRDKYKAVDDLIKFLVD